MGGFPHVLDADQGELALGLDIGFAGCDNLVLTALQVLARLDPSLQQLSMLLVGKPITPITV